MKRLMSYLLSALLLVGMLLPTQLGLGSVAFADEPTDPQIVMNPSMVSGLSTQNSIGNLVDEQDADVPTTTWTFSSAAGFPTATIDLGGRYHITTVSLYHQWGSGTVTIGAGLESENIGTLYVDDFKVNGTNKYNYWSNTTVDVVARYLTVVRQASMTEIKIYGTAIPDDNTPPAAVTDLTAAINAGSDPSLRLSWTAPGNDGNTGTAASYDIRYSSSPITAENWDDATPLTGLPTPLVAGSAQTFDWYDYQDEATYYFAMKAADDWEVPNVSELSNVAQITTPVDTTPPAAVTDLAVSSTGSQRVHLTFTAVGDNGNRGTATSYELRYSQSPITAENFASATLVENLPAPVTAGAQQTLTVSGLSPQTTYYFALKVSDEAGNTSALSNVASGITAEPDLTAPSTVSDLAVTMGEEGAVFTWTAPGNDGNVGTASAYELRYSTEPITDENWASATLATGLPTPAVSGTAQTYTLPETNKGLKLYAAIKAIDEDNNVSSLSNVVSFGFVDRIMLNKDMVITEVPMGLIYGLVDEQEEIGDVAGALAKGTVPSYVPSKGWNQLYSWSGQATSITQSVVIDLGAEYDLTDLYVYDTFSDAMLEIYGGTPFQWTLFAEYDQKQHTKWVKVPLNQHTRYLRFITRANNVAPLEIALYGVRTTALATVPEPTPHDYPTMDKIVGANGFIDDPLDVLAAVGNIREYHNWDWNDSIEDYPNNTIAFLSNSKTNWWNFDDYYKNLQQMGVSVTPVIQGGKASVYGSRSYKPVADGDDPEDPASYKCFAEFYFQYAARYGSATVDDSLLKVYPGQPRLSGLGYLSALECTNEPDATWVDRKGYYTPYEYAALASAAYDGHQNTMGPGVGVKNADPNFELIMGGTANVESDSHLNRIKAMKFWFDFNRTDGVIPFAALNIHTYCTNTGGQNTGTDSYGISPEAAQMKEMVSEIVDYRDRYMPDKEVWISEFGWDVDQRSPSRATVYGDHTGEEVQAMWLTRAYLILASTGVDRAEMYMSRDASTGAPGKYATCGLVTDKASGEIPRMSWYYVYTLKNRMADMHFVQEINSGNDNVWIYQFADENGKKAYALWCPTSDDTTVSNYELSLLGSPESMTLVNFADKNTEGTQISLPVVNGKVTVNVGETPILLFEGDLAQDTAPVWPENAEISVNFINDSSVKVNWPVATDDKGIAFYKVYDGTTVKSIITPDKQPNGLSLVLSDNKNQYNLRIIAIDETGKATATELTTTIKKPDRTPPTAPETLTPVLANSSQVLLEWSAATDNIGVTAYKVYMNGTLVATIQNVIDEATGEYLQRLETRAILSNLTPGTTYSFTVTAVDEGGNESEPSPAVSVVTETAASAGGDNNFWNGIKNQIDAAAAGSTVTALATDNVADAVPLYVLQALQSKNVTLVIEWSGGTIALNAPASPAPESEPASEPAAPSSEPAVAQVASTAAPSQDVARPEPQPQQPQPEASAAAQTEAAPDEQGEVPIQSLPAACIPASLAPIEPSSPARAENRATSQMQAFCDTSDSSPQQKGKTRVYGFSPSLRTEAASHPFRLNC